MDTKIKKNEGFFTTFDITMEGLTVGKVKALENALIAYSKKSAVCKDILASFSKACEEKVIQGS